MSTPRSGGIDAAPRVGAAAPARGAGLMAAGPTFAGRLQAAAPAAIADAAPTLEPEPGRLQFVTIDLALDRHGEVLEATYRTERVPAPGGGGRGATVSHPTDWRCRSEACRMLLGWVRDRVLYPVVPVPFIDARGVARLPCPRRGTARHWFPSDAAARNRGENLLDGLGAVAGPLRLHAAGMAT